MTELELAIVDLYSEENVYKPIWDDLMLAWYAYDKAILHNIVTGKPNTDVINRFQVLIGDHLRSLIKKTGITFDRNSVVDDVVRSIKNCKEITLELALNPIEGAVFINKIETSISIMERFDDFEYPRETLANEFSDFLRFIATYERLRPDEWTKNLVKIGKKWLGKRFKNYVQKIVLWEKELKKFPKSKRRSHTIYLTD